MLSYLILKFIYKIIFKSTKSVSKFLVFLGSIGLIIFYYTPDSYYLEPSYWQFRNMCKLNELPNNEEKYNKILSYFGLSLDTLDWEELNRRAYKISKEQQFYLQNFREYATYIGEIKKTRYDIMAILYSNKKLISKDNITSIILLDTWNTRRYNLEQESMASYNIEWIEIEEYCSLYFNTKEQKWTIKD
nr:hypothetical protein [Campylobacter coli]